MNLLGAVLYDPIGGAVSKVTTSLLAMTALDTTNLRIAFTIPAHGMVAVKMSGVHHGATTTAQMLFGVLEGATLRGRMVAQKNLLGTAVATSMIRHDVEYVVTGLTPGAVNWDAAYGVEIVSSAGGAIKYGGPNNTTTNDGFGGFRFEVWDPRPLPTAAPGAANGVLISGSNAGTTTLGALTVTGATTHTGATIHTGNVSFADGITVAAPSTGNRAGLDISGNGTGAGIKAVGGATGHGMLAQGGATSGDGINAAAATSGHGVVATGAGTTRHGINATGGATSSDGFRATGGGTGHGINALSGSGATGSGARFVASSTNGNGMQCVGSGTGHGIFVNGGDTSGHGINAVSGTGATGNGIRAASASTDGDGIRTTGTGTGSDIFGDITGNLSGSVGSVTTVSDKTGYSLSSAGVTAIWAEVMEGAVTAVQMMRGFASALMGKASGLATTTAVYRNLGDTKDRITATVDSDGNRTAVTRDLT